MNFKKNSKNLSLNNLESEAPCVPSHVAIIMDGNGRWAKKHHFGRIRGHRAGVKAIRAATKAASKLGVKYLTLYAFSTENWNRPEDEVNALWNLLIEFIDKEVPKLKKNNVRLHCIGRIREIPLAARKKIKWGKDETSKCTGLNLILAINYGGRQELADAINDIIADKKPKVDEHDISNYLYTNKYPDPDLLIRTSGEKRLSNFLLWQLSYAELIFLDVLWPDFRQEHFTGAVSEFNLRQRRFGGL